jgi:hypothetical protein
MPGAIDEVERFALPGRGEWLAFDCRYLATGMAAAGTSLFVLT